jgi:plastocyanin domain-containing protein
MKKIIISVLIAIIIIGGSFVLKNNVSFSTQNNQKVGTENNNNQKNNADNVSVVDGKQIVDIRVKGGYQPNRSFAKAGLATVLRFDTNGTFDCSSSVRIPSMNISKLLPQTGSTDIDIGTQQAGIFQGTCGMGMYNFEVAFQ